VGASQAEITRAVPLRLGTAAVAADPVDGETLPHWVMSPWTTTGLQTTGLAIGLKAPAVNPATAVAAGFSVVLWIWNPLTGAWFACATAVIPYGQPFGTFDFNASGIYLQIAAASVAAAGDVDVHAWEQ
jgi:hypothetical protein